MSKSRSITPSRLLTYTPSKSPSKNPELFFQKGYFQPENPFYKTRLQSLLSYLIDIDIEDLPSLSSRKPFHFLLESLLEDIPLFNKLPLYNNKSFKDPKDSNNEKAPLNNNKEESSYSNFHYFKEIPNKKDSASISLLVSNALLLSNVFVQLLRLLNLDLKLDKEQISVLYRFLIGTMELVIEKTEKEEFEEISSIVPQSYFLLEAIEKYKILTLLFTKEEGFSNLARVFFGSGRLQSFEPEIGSLLINIVLEIGQKDDFFEIMMEELLPGLIKSLARKHENKENYNFCIKLVKQFPLKLLKRLNKHFLHQYKLLNINKNDNNKNKDLTNKNKKENLSKLKELLQAMKIVFKINEEVLLDIMTYIENDLLHQNTSDEKKAILLVFFARVSSQKSSKLSILQPRIFKELLNTLSKRTFSRFRYEFLKSLLKYLYNHMDKRPISLQIEAFPSKPYLINLKLIENELFNMLSSPDKDFPPKLFLLNQSLANLNKSSLYLSQEFLQSLGSLILKEGFPLKESLYSFFSGLFLQNNRETRFPWLLKEILGFSYKSTKKASVFFLHAFNEILFNSNEQGKSLENIQKLLFNQNKQEKAIESPKIEENSIFSSKIEGKIGISNEKTFVLRQMLEIHEDIIKQVLSEGLFSISDEKNYPNFLYKLLGLKWRVFYEKMRDSEGIVMKKSWERILKLREKISNHAKSLFIEENTKEKRYFSEIKLIKYCGELGDIKKVSEALISLLNEDPNAKPFLLKLGTIEQRDISLDFFLKKLKEDNLSLLLSVWFPQDLLWDSNYESFIIKELKEALLLEEDGFLKGFAICDLLLLLKKAFKISFSLVFIKEIVSLIEGLVKGGIEEWKGVLAGLMLKILARNRVYKLVKDDFGEEMKGLFCNMIKIERSTRQMKYLGVLIKQLDEISKKKDFKLLAINALERVQEVINYNSNNGSIMKESKEKEKNNDNKNKLKENKNHPEIKEKLNEIPLKVLTNDIKILRISIEESLEEQLSTFNSQILKTLLFLKTPLLNTPLPEPKGLLISHLALLKRDLILSLKPLFYYINDLERTFFLKDLLTLSLNETPQTDYLFLRVLSFRTLLELFSQRKLGLIPKIDEIVSLSLVCTTKDPEIRKLAFHLLIQFASKKEAALSLAFLSLLFLFLGDQEKSLGFLASRFLSKLALTIERKTERKTKGLPFKIRIENSLQYSIVFLIGILLKNPKFKGVGKGGLDYKMVSRFLEGFFGVFEEREMGYFYSIMNGLRKGKPIEEDLKDGYMFLIEIIIGIMEKKTLKEEVLLEDIDINPLGWLEKTDYSAKKDLQRFKKEIGEFLEVFERKEKGIMSKSKGKVIIKKEFERKKIEKGKEKKENENIVIGKKIKVSEK